MGLTRRCTTVLSSRAGGYIRQDLAKAVQVQDENLDDGRNPFKSTQDGGEPKKRRSSI
ncbi:MAG: hypothetical protein LBE98_00035 [Puniceicoccales bacterium]|nr:hypothetical protein [Puniceicoccales bacterium]